MESLVASSFNFLLLVGILTYKLKTPVRDFVSQRHRTIREEVHSVQAQLRLAEEKYDEFSSKLKAIGAELGSLRDQSKQEAGAIKQRILNEARRSATMISSDSKTAAIGLYSDLKNQLYTELSTQVLDRAEVLLKERLTGDDRVRIQQEFSRQVEKMQ